MEEETDIEQGPNSFNDWENLPSNHNHSSSSSSSSSSSPSSSSSLRITPYNDDLTIFPPINHEGLPIPPPPRSPPHAPPSAFNSDPDSRSSTRTRNTHLATWFDFALHIWNSKLISVFTHLGNGGLFSKIRPFSVTASFLVVLCFWVLRLRRQRRRFCGDESVEQLKRVIKEKDEIVQLLEQIAQMNKLLLARHRIPVLRPRY